jgi:hypothetical protein
MEMPTSPVLFCIHPDGKVFADLEENWREYKAVPIPPHGDLIDRVALPTPRVEWEDVVNAPTIIPASEKGE